MPPSIARGCAALVLVLVLSPAPARSWGWEAVRGDGSVAVRKRDLPAFHAVRVEGSLDVTVKVGPPRSVTVEIDENLQALLSTRVRDDTLVISTEGSIRPSGRAGVEVTVPELRRLQLVGSGDVAVEGGAGALDLEVRGSGDLRWQGEVSTLQAAVGGSGNAHLQGHAALLRAEVKGSGDIDASRLEAVDVEARVKGSGDIELKVAGGKLSAEVDGSGDIRWRGTAASERVAVHGSGGVSRRD